MQFHGSWSRSDSGLQLTASVSGSNTLHITVTDGQISGSGSGTYHQSPISGTIDAGGQSATITAAGFQASETDSVSGTVSSDNTASLVVTATSTNAPASISGTLTAQIDGQTQTEPFDIPVTYNSGGNFQVKLQDGYSTTVPVSANGIQGQIVLTVSASSSSPSTTFTPSPSASASQTPSLTLTDVQGNVQVERNGVKITTSQLQYGDKVTTGDGSSATITFNDGSIVKLGPNSTFKLSSNNETQSVITLLLGKIHAFLNPRFQTRTPSGTASIRGTEFVLEVTENGTTTLTVLSHAVDFSDTGGMKTVSVGENQTSVVTPGGEPSDPVLINPSQIDRWWEEEGATTGVPTYAIVVAVAAIVVAVIVVTLVFLKKRPKSERLQSMPPPPPPPPT